MIPYVPHPAVWALVAGVVGLGGYAARVVGPKVSASPVTRRQRGFFAVAIAILWLMSDWPIHDLGEQELYSVHMLQHLALTFVVPPLLLLATPPWLARLVIGDGWFAGPFLRWLTHPVVAGVTFNALAMLTHWQAVVNLSVRNGAFHYVIHVALVGASLLMWMPVCGPLRERLLSRPGQMVYLFLMSIVPTVPAGWLTFAEGAVYSAYDRPDRLWGVSVTTDQQIAGALMKLGGGFFLWGLIVVIFFQWAGDEMRTAKPPRRVSPPAELPGQIEQTPTMPNTPWRASTEAPTTTPTAAMASAAGTQFTSTAAGRETNTGTSASARDRCTAEGSAGT